MSDGDTVPTFASLPHPARTWRLVLFYLRDELDLLDVAQLLAAGVTESERIARALEISVEEVEVRKAAIHREVARLRAKILAGRRLAASFKAPS